VNQATCKKMRDFGVAKYRETQRLYRENGLRGETESCKRILRSTLPQVGEAITKELEFYSHRRNNPPLFLMFVMDIDGYELGHICLKTLMDMMDSLPKLQEVGVSIGSAVEAVARRRYFEEHRGEWDAYLLKKKQKVLKGNRRSQMEVFFEEEEKHERHSDFIRFKLWEPHHKAGLGLGYLNKSGSTAVYLNCFTRSQGLVTALNTSVQVKSLITGFTGLISGVS